MSTIYVAWTNTNKLLPSIFMISFLLQRGDQDHCIYIIIYIYDYAGGPILFVPIPCFYVVENTAQFCPPSFYYQFLLQNFLGHNRPSQPVPGPAPEKKVTIYICIHIYILHPRFHQTLIQRSLDTHKKFHPLK